MELAAASRRQSLVFFHNPNYDALIDCIPSCQGPGQPAKYPPITSGEHLRRQFVRTQMSVEAQTAAAGAPAGDAP
jgi:isopenicillin N synthase-like dioxygenase